MDMSTTVAPKSNQLNADDLIAGPMTIIITKVSPSGSVEQPVAVSFEGDDGKPYLPCKSMRRVMISAWGVNATEYVGRAMTLYRDPKVLWGGMEVGGIRISHMTHIDREMVMALTATQKKRVPYTVKPLKQERPAQPKQDAGPDRATAVVEALEARVKAAENMAALAAITAEQTVIQQRQWLRDKRPELADRLNEAVKARLDSFAQDDDVFPGDLPGEAA